MSFTTLVARLAATVDRDDLTAEYPKFVNKAIRDISDRHSFDEMKVSSPVTWTLGQREITAPANFKELQNARFALVRGVNATNGTDDAETPIPVYTRSEIEHLSAFRPDLYATLIQDVRPYKLRMQGPAPANETLTLYYFGYPADLTDPPGGSPDAIATALVTSYDDLVFSRAAYLAFKDINDPAAKFHGDAFDAALQALGIVDIVKSKTEGREEKE